MSLESKIKKIFRDKVRLNEKFTALDIANDFRGKEHKKAIDCLGILWKTGEIISFGYTRSLTGKGEYVYHPRGEYPPRGDFEVPKDELMFVVSKTEPSVRSRYLKRSSRGDGAVEIPSILVSKLKLKAGDKVYGNFDIVNSELVISRKNNGGIEFTIYKTGETRIPKKVVEKYFPNNRDFSVRIVGLELRLS